MDLKAKVGPRKSPKRAREICKHGKKNRKQKSNTVNGVACPFTHENSSERSRRSMSEATA